MADETIEFDEVGSISFEATSRRVIFPNSTTDAPYGDTTNTANPRSIKLDGVVETPNGTIAATLYVEVNNGRAGRASYALTPKGNYILRMDVSEHEFGAAVSTCQMQIVDVTARTLEQSSKDYDKTRQQVIDLVGTNKV